MKRRDFVFFCVAVPFIYGCESKDVFLRGNSEQKPLEFRLGGVVDPVCRMDVEYKEYSAQLALKSGKTYIFDDPGCLILFMHELDSDILEGAKSFVYTNDTRKYIDATKAYYSRTDPTPMHYGFGAYEKSFEDAIDFEEASTLMLRGETLNNPTVARKLLSED
ncbi:MAG: hypothetical protein ACLFQJ_00455 [Campylobacterales bacterium]